ncbi:MAG: thioredoxin-dependent thiol peroxidase [Desulfobulbaceae bacterium]|nr:thioredoxin-dependent thiol peroxidase [Desulfobulbaceae bacterium]
MGRKTLKRINPVLIKNAYIINAEESIQADILIGNSIFEKINPGIDSKVKNEEIIYASGYYVFPGGIDVHTHMELQSSGTISSDDFESGTKAAISGGTTTIIDFTTPARAESLLSSLDERLKLAEKSLCDYSLHIGVTYFGKNTAREIEECANKGFTSFKIYMAYKDSIGLEDEDIIKVLEAVKKAGGLVTVHCENGDIINELQNIYRTEGKTSPKYHPLSRPPETEGEDLEGQKVKLSDYLGKKVILFAYPKAGTSGCTTQACGLRDNFPRFEAANATVLGISPDEPAALRNWKDAENLPYDLVSDPDHKVLEAWGAWGEKSMYGKSYMGIERTTVVIDEEGMVTHIFPRVKVDGHTREILNIL